MVLIDAMAQYSFVFGEKRIMFLWQTSKKKGIKPYEIQEGVIWRESERGSSMW